MVITSNLERIYFNYILKNPEYFKNVIGEYFENSDIKFIYNCIRNEYLSSIDKTIPSKAEIINLIKSKDIKDEYSIDLIKKVLTVDFKEYRDEFIIPRFKAWILANSSITGLVNSIELIKGIDKTDFKKVSKVVDDIRIEMENATNLALDKDNLGLDFDDPDAHNQEAYINKISTGYDTLNTILGGGFDRKTLNVLMGKTSGFKSGWMQNFAVNAANAGYIVAYITLELSEKKCLKRLGSMRLEINISEYGELAKDREFMKARIAQMNSKFNSTFSENNGKIFIKEYPSGSATILDIENYIKLVKEQTGLSIDLLCVDYIQIMGCMNGVDRNMLYLKGEHLAVGLRAIAQKHNLVALTATQIAKDKYDANDIFLNDMPESKAIADTADTVWAIIQTPIMKREGKFHLKHLKLRDSETDFDRVGFTFNKQYLKCHSDYFVEAQI